MSIERIVVGVDGSPGSEQALRWTAELAAELGAAVTCVHAFEPLRHLDEVGPDADLHRLRDEVTGLARDVWSRPLVDLGVGFEVRVVDGLSADTIIDVARELDADLIVVGGRRMGRLKELALGSTTRKVLHEARRPVVVIHPPEG